MDGLKEGVMDGWMSCWESASKGDDGCSMDGWMDG